MKLTYFSQQTLPRESGGGGKKLPKVAFGKTGVIAFNKAACRQIGLKAGDRVTLAQDPNTPENWYFFKDAQYGYELRSAYKDQGAQFNHATLVRTLMEAMEMETGKTHSFRIGGEPTILKGDKAQTKYWGILIS